MHTETAAAEWSLQLSKELAELVAKLLGNGAGKMAAALLAALSRPEQHPGLIQIMKLAAKGDDLQIARLSKEQYARFSKTAPKYGLFYSAARQKDGVMDVIFGSSQISVMNHVLAELGLGELSKNVEAPPQSLDESKESSKAAAPTMERGKTSQTQQPPEAHAPTPAAAGQEAHTLASETAGQEARAPAQTAAGQEADALAPAAANREAHDPAPAAANQADATVPKTAGQEANTLPPATAKLQNHPAVQAALKQMPNGLLDDVVVQIDHLEVQLADMNARLAQLRSELSSTTPAAHALAHSTEGILAQARNQLDTLKARVLEMCKSITDKAKQRSIGAINVVMEITGIREGLSTVINALTHAAERLDRLHEMAFGKSAPAAEQAPTAERAPAVEQAPAKTEPEKEPQAERPSGTAEKASVIAKVDKIVQRQAETKNKPSPEKKKDGMER